MATHASAKKRARQTIVRNQRNRHNGASMRSVVKTLREAIAKKDLGSLDSLLVKAQSALAVACRKGVIHKNNMARNISRLTLAVTKAKKA